MAFALLEENLLEIEAANFQDTGLVANYSGSRIYQKSSFLGRIWCFFFSVFQRFKPGVEKEALFHAMRKTENLFKEHLKSIKSACQSYKTYLDLRHLNVPVDETKYHEVRSKILDWNRFVRSFIKKHFANPKNSNYPLIETLSDEIHKQSFNIKEPILYQRLIALEGTLHGPIPWALFKSLKEGKPLEKKEKAELIAWIKRYSAPGSPLKIGPFHAALKAFCEIVQGPLTTTSLEAKLEDLGLLLFIQSDPLLLEWRKSLKPGSVLQTSNGKITLGEFLPGGEPDESRNWVFAIEGDPKRVVVIGINCAVQNFKKRIQENDGAVIPSARLVEIAPSGKFAVYERLYDSLASQAWKSNSKQIENNDLQVLRPVIRWIEWMIKNDTSPTRLDPKLMMFNSQNRLTYAKVCKHQGFCHPLIEDFIVKMSKQNRWIFAYLMEKTGMAGLSAAQFYHQVVLKALKRKRIDSQFSNGFGITDPRVVDRAKLLEKQVIEAFDRCKYAILERYDVPERELQLLQQMISAKFYKLYQDLKCGGILFPGMKDQVISEVVEKGGWRSRGS